jgi:hypothetical protein
LEKIRRHPEKKVGVMSGRRMWRSFEHLRVHPVVRDETPGGSVAAVVSECAPEARGAGELVADSQTREGIPAGVGARGESRTSDRTSGVAARTDSRTSAITSGSRGENLTGQVERLKRLVAAHDQNLTGSNLERAREVVRLGVLMSICLKANPRLRKKDLAKQVGKHAAWVTRYTRAACLAQDAERMSADQATAILLKAHGNVQRAAKQGRGLTAQSRIARIVRAVHDALRLGTSALEIRAFVEPELPGAELPELRPYATPDKEWRS